MIEFFFSRGITVWNGVAIEIKSELDKPRNHELITHTSLCLSWGLPISLEGTMAWATGGSEMKVTCQGNCVIYVLMLWWKYAQGTIYKRKHLFELCGKRRHGCRSVWQRQFTFVVNQEAESIWNFNRSPIVRLFCQLEPRSWVLMSLQKLSAVSEKKKTWTCRGNFKFKPWQLLSNPDMARV